MRIRAVDWLRGLVIMLMTVDHAGVFDAAHMRGDNYRSWIAGSPLPAGEFLTRWITHLCAPTFVLLAGVSLALSAEKRRDEPGQTSFIVKRGLLIAALDPLWMALGFAGYTRFPLAVLYAIGMSMVCMAFLRRLPSRVLLAGAFAIQLLGELSSHWSPDIEPLATLWKLLLTGGPITSWGLRCGYPLLPWLSIMMAGWVVGRWLVQPASHAARARTLALIGAALLATFVVVRGINDYGNWRLYRESLDVLQWLHVNKYPPSISFTTLELGISFLAFAGFTALDGRLDAARKHRVLDALALFGSTAFFYYLLHVHILSGTQLALDLDRTSHGLAKTWLGATLVLALLALPCVWYRRYKRTHPDSWTRYL